MIDKKDSFPNRLRAIRGFLRLTRQEFADRHGIPEITLKYWELSKTSISANQVKKLLNALAKEEFYCTKEWLLTGEGTSPFSSDNKNTSNIKGIEAEREFFLQNNPNSITQVVVADTLNSLYTKGDIVGGIEVNSKDNTLAKFPAIVWLENHSQQSIYYAIFNKPKEIVLTDHTDLTQAQSTLWNPDIKKLYKIIWHRKPN